VKLDARTLGLLFLAPCLFILSQSFPDGPAASPDESLASESSPASSSDTGISEDCLFCHDQYDATLEGTPHWIRETGVAVACSYCHLGAEAHLEEPDITTITNPARAEVSTTLEICTSCHTGSHEQSMLEGSVHARNGVSCTGCHKLHENPNASLLRAEEETELCWSCHPGERGDFSLPYRHPVNDGVMTCSECHAVHEDGLQRFTYAGENEVCYGCHEELQGPFPYPHEATLDYSTEEGGCLNCHAAHGSTQPRMLKQPYEAPNFAVCSQCHVVPPGHRFNINHGAQWDGVPCSQCHSDIHGSYFSEKLLSPALQADGCFNPGCHQP
jgi:DmsE family decaheme c-type cytochrome